MEQKIEQVSDLNFSGGFGNISRFLWLATATGGPLFLLNMALLGCFEDIEGGQHPLKIHSRLWGGFVVFHYH